MGDIGMTAALTITRESSTRREEYDENDPAAVAEMRAKFEAVAPGALAYKTVPGTGVSETIHRSEFPEVGEAVEVTVSPQFYGG
jgi:hypothetical protein